MAPEATGLAFTNVLLPDPEAQNHNLLNGSGLALGDYDADGWCDVFLCNLNGTSTLYRNRGNWRFEDATVRAGLANTNWLARGAAFADVEGDGDLDLIVTFSGKGARLFRNDGAGRFEDAQATELVADTGSTSVALGDLDGDRDLDLYVANYGENTIRSGAKVTTRVVGGKDQVVGRFRNRLKIIGGNLVEYGEPDAVYRNDGRGRFQRLSWTDGTFRDETGASLAAAPWELGFTVVIRDLDQDGDADLYVSNDFQDPDRLWLNDGRGRFQAAARATLRSGCYFSMASDFSDVNRDGLDDFMVTDMLSRYHPMRMTQLHPAPPPIEQTLERAADRPQVRRNFLFLNRGDGTYTEVANFAGTATSDWSWTIVFLDVDLDGYEDVLIGTGHYYDTQDLDAIEGSKALSATQRLDGRQILAMFPLLQTPNVAFRNRGNLTFEEVGKPWGFDSLQVSHSLGCADLDNDGDQDVVVNCLKAPALLYRNDSGAPRVAVTLKGNPPNTRGIGARITLRGGAVPLQSDEMSCGGHYLAGDDTVRTFAAGSLTNVMSLDVVWPGGHRSLIRDVKANRLYEIAESGAAPLEATPVAPPPAPFFEDVSAVLAHRHEESTWTETRQTRLPRRFSELGPGVTWFDFDGDGDDDLMIGAGRGGKLARYRNEGGGRFSRLTDDRTGPLLDDAGGIVGWRSSPRTASLFLAESTCENATNSHGITQRGFVEGDFSFYHLHGFGHACPGPLALGDFNGDGDLDLFAGGRLVPGRYPEPADSVIRLGQLPNDGPPRLSPEYEGTVNAALKHVGLVSGAVFTDLNGDGRPELVLACEWGPVRVFEFEGQSVRDVTEARGLANFLGLWNSVTAGDFDEDGRLDLVAGNWGLNCAYQQVAPGPWYLYYGDLNGDGGVQVLEAYHDGAMNQIVPWRDLQFLEPDLPWLRERFPTHKAFSVASVPDILGDRVKTVQRLTVNTLASMLFLNRGDRFEARPLPAEAQWSPAMGLAVGDLDGDGHEDLFISQNFFGVRPEEGRLDAGRGLWLQGDGRGDFRPVPGQESGIRVYEEQRGGAVADYDADGRLDLVVTQNNADTKLYRNVKARPGLRVRLRGPIHNPEGVGAVLQLKRGDGWSPAREVRAGGGYWSQDSAEQVLAMPQSSVILRVRWPGGKVTESPIPPQSKAVWVDAEGHVQDRP